MKNQINIGDQNDQQIGQNPDSQPAQISEKSKINYWMISTIALVFLLFGLLIITFIYSRKSCLRQPSNSEPPANITTVTPTEQANEYQQSNIVIDKIYLHKAGKDLQLIDQSSLIGQRIKNITTKIITPTLDLPVEQREKITLVVDQEDFPRASEKSDYIEIQSKQLFTDDIEKWKYDKIRFILRGNTGIWGHSAEYKGQSNSFWNPWWGPYDTNLFWSLGEFLGVPSPTPQTESPIQHQQTSPLIR